MNDFKLDSNADHELSESGTSGTVYILIPMHMNELSVEVYFETDARQSINLISIGDAFQDIEGVSEDYNYTLLPEHEQPIRAVINQYLADNPIDDSEPQDYDTADSLGFSHSDWLYA